MSSAPGSDPIGVFDSGVGGLTVLKALRARLPHESFIYLGDTARVPYGTKSPATVARYATNIADVLVEQGVKAIVVACNTASAFGLDAVRNRVSVPVVDVIEPVSRAVARDPATRRVTVLGTRGTVASGSYPRAIAALRQDVDVTQQPCPLLVPLAEEGWTSGPIPRAVVESYLEATLVASPPDALILGCTHYPLLAAEIEAAALRHCATPVVVHESGPATAEALVEALAALGLLAPASDAAPTVRYLVTDDPRTFERVGSAFLGEPVVGAEHVAVGTA